MYYCRGCNKFVIGEKWEDENRRCGECGGTALEKAKKCKVCGEPTLENYCDWCIDETTSMVRWLLKGLSAKTIDAGLLQEACNKICQAYEKEGTI